MIFHDTNGHPTNQTNVCPPTLRYIPLLEVEIVFAFCVVLSKKEANQVCGTEEEKLG